MDAAIETELLARAQGGDGAAFEELITPHLPGLYRLCRGVLRDTGLAEQAVQEALRRAWEARWGCRGAFKSWLYTVARNVALDTLKEAHHRHSVPLEGGIAEAVNRTGEPFEETVIRRHLIEDALSRLSLDAREIIILNHYAGLDLREAADVIGISHDAARQRCGRAVKSLRAIMQLQSSDSPSTDRNRS
ncbi:MAG: RNA polymerase sigma factor [Thermomicrobiales bacterium]